MMSRLLGGRVALVTGASRGLGLAICRRFAAEGAVGTAFDLPGAEADAADALPDGFTFAGGDVRDEDALAAAVTATVDRHGRLDILVANAGLVPPWRETEELDFAEWDRVMAVNVRGVAAALKQAIPAMKAAGGGAVVAMASVNAVVAHPRQMLYTASKHAVLGIVRAAARDLGRHGIRVNGLAPGPIATDALVARIEARAESGAGPAADAALDAFAAATSLGRLATIEDVAKAALFLASDLSSGITGALLPVDAGLT